MNLAIDGLVVDEERLSAKIRFLLGSLRLLSKNGMSREELISVIGVAGENADDRFESVMREFVEKLTLQSTRVICVTVDNHNDAMWENYAEGRKGALLKFRHVPEYSTPLLAAKQVAYAPEHPVVASGLDFLLFGDTRELRQRCLDAIVYTKRAQWKYQREWRAVTWSTDGSGALYDDYPFHDAELASLTVGAEASDSWASTIRHLMASRYPQCELLRDAGRASD